jgi:hypothetical protein
MASTPEIARSARQLISRHAWLRALLVHLQKQQGRIYEHSQSLLAPSAFSTLLESEKVNVGSKPEVKVACDCHIVCTPMSALVFECAWLFSVEGAEVFVPG